MKKQAPKKAKAKFKKGQAVALYSDRNGLRFDYEYVRSTARHHVVLDLENGQEYHVWFDKVLSMKKAERLYSQILKHNEKAA